MKIEGRGGISAKIIADSVSVVNGKRITTFELEYPRFIHAEFMTHRLFSRNAASSRAIPVTKVIDQVYSNTAKPIHWGRNQPGMQANEDIGGHMKERALDDWATARDSAVGMASDLHHVCNVHKQIVNRLLEPFQFIKVVCTATEFENFFWLRDHEDAQPEIAELARCMVLARERSVPQRLMPGDWHVPYVDFTNAFGYTIPVDGDYENGRIDLSVDEALKVSASCCAQVSFRLLDNSMEKALKIYDTLVTSEPVHASPFEHQATPMGWPNELNNVVVAGFERMVADWDGGATHMDKEGNIWSGNFCGWIQHRQLIPNNVKAG